MLIRVVLIVLFGTMAFGQIAVDAQPANPVPYPRLIRAELPLYPPAAWSAHLGGTVEIDVTVEKGIVADARVKRGMVETQGADEKSALKKEQQDKLLSYLSLPSVANVKTWQFQPSKRGVLPSLSPTCTRSRERKRPCRRILRSTSTCLAL